MKKILNILIFVLCFLLGSLIVYSFFNKNNNINNFSVYIECINEDSISTGSGFVYEKDNNKNYIITNYHVIENYNNIYIYNTNKDKIKASILNYDEYTDLAILTIEDELDLDSVNIGNSDKLNIGDEIYTIGTPLNISNISTITNGIITDLNKLITINTTHGMSEFSTIEMNIDVDSGNSGGPLLNHKDEVIGVVFIKEDSNNNIAYALPINFVMDIITKLENNQINRPNLGAIMTNTTNIDLMSKYGISQTDIKGVVLLEIYEGYNYGFQKGDIITKFNNNDISNVNQLRKELYKFNKGDNVEIEYYRDSVSYKVNINL